MESLLLILLLLGTVCHAANIEGRDISIDNAIKSASVNRTSGILRDSDSVLVELDILYKIDTYIELKKQQQEAVSGGRVKRKAIIPESRYRWTDKTIPYEISPVFTPREIAVINYAITKFHQYTCIRLKPATSSDSNKVRFIKGNGCYSYVGMVGNTQDISLGRGCVYNDIAIHEIGHAIGFQHEQTRTDRDDFVTILRKNVNPRMLFNFQKYTDKQVNLHGVPYDYTSVMHYGQYAFSMNSEKTIIAKDPKYQEVMGKSPGLSYNDIKLANAMYECAAECTPKRCPEGAFQGKNCACWCNSGNKDQPIRVCQEVSHSPISAPGALDPAQTIPEKSTTCRDGRSSCFDWAQYCDDVVLGEYIQEQCRDTCGLC